MNTKNMAMKIRLHTLRMTHLGKSSHIGSIFSIADILAVLYGSILNVDPLNPRWQVRDRFILSKGHAGAAVYAALAESGFFDVEKLLTHYQDGSDLSGHVSHKGVPGVEFSTGSLGHGLPVGCGMALSAKRDNAPHRVFVLLSDGECDEGSNWEAALFAAQYKLGNLCAVIDYNKLQSLGPVSETINLEPFAEKWRAFGWDVHEVDGHNHGDINSALDFDSGISVKPRCVIANTTKGKGVSFMENSVLWHYRSAQGVEYEAALKELSGASNA
jgi:transketolase